MGKLITTFSPRVSILTSPLSIAFCSCLANSVASRDASLSPPAPSKSESFFLSNSPPSGESSSFVCNSSSGFCNSVVCWRSVSVTDGVGLGLKFNEMTVVPFGCSTTGTTFCTPNASRSEPEICLNLGTLNSANDRIKTKKAIKSVAMSAKVAIHAGAPTGGHLGHSGSSCSSSLRASSAIIFYFASPTLQFQI